MAAGLRHWQDRDREEFTTRQQPVIDLSKQQVSLMENNLLILLYKRNTSCPHTWQKTANLCLSLDGMDADDCLSHTDITVCLVQRTNTFCQLLIRRFCTL